LSGIKDREKENKDRLFSVIGQAQQQKKECNLLASVAYCLTVFKHIISILTR
jgi:hypothetical protein